MWWALPKLHLEFYLCGALLNPVCWEVPYVVRYAPLTHPTTTTLYPLPSINDFPHFPTDPHYFELAVHLADDSAPLPGDIYSRGGTSVVAVGGDWMWIYGVAGGIEPASRRGRSIDPSQLSSMGTQIFCEKLGGGVE